MDNFFGSGTGSSQYDIRRHIHVILVEFISYKYYTNQIDMNQFESILRMEDQYEAASAICNDILSYEEHNFLNYLRERYNMPETDFTAILSGIGYKEKMHKTPAGYNTVQNWRFLVQMCVARYYMRPQNQEAFTKINTMIVQIASGMPNIGFSEQKIQKLFRLEREAMATYPNLGLLEQIENYVIERI